MRTIKILRISGLILCPLSFCFIFMILHFNIGDASKLIGYVGFVSFAIAVLWSLLILFFGNKIYRDRKTKFDKVLFGLVAGPALTFAVIWMLSEVVFPILKSCVW